MKKILIISGLIALAALTTSPAIFAAPMGSVIAACNLTGGACSGSNLYRSPLQDKLMPNTVNQIQRPDYFQKPNTETNFGINQPAAIEGPEDGIYSPNCQFGVCMPTAEEAVPR